MADWSYQDNRKFLSKTRRDRELVKKLLGKKKDDNNTRVRGLRKQDDNKRK